jgi:hypothetical protein
MPDRCAHHAPINDDAEDQSITNNVRVDYPVKLVTNRTLPTSTQVHPYEE